MNERSRFISGNLAHITQNSQTDTDIQAKTQTQLHTETDRQTDREE